MSRPVKIIIDTFGSGSASTAPGPAATIAVTVSGCLPWHRV